MNGQNSLSIFRVFYNFVWFLLRLFNNRNLDGGPKVDKIIHNNRLEKCYNCTLLTKRGFLAKFKGPRCSICGCFVEWKTLYKFEECPNTENKKWNIEI